MNFNFVASHNLDLCSFKDIEKFVDDYPDFQTVVLNDEDELKVLLELMGIPDAVCINVNSPEFSKYWDLSAYQLPELSDEQFDQFYENWIQKSSRDNNMDEYGSLIFLQQLSSKWNKLNYRLIVKEND
ncbi:MAG: hypothetical protein IPJ81_09520 [Chitinophagaceae bacterium]|nr:hypothetical protein [Chitinophagaceae bacterium]